MKGLAAALALLLFVAAGIGAFMAHGAMQVAVGYSAKQLCSAVFVSNLPREFVTARDILPRMQILGPLRDALELRAEPDDGFATASLLGVSARAVHRSGRGCTLGMTGNGDPPMALPALAAQPDPLSVDKPVSTGPLMAAMDSAFAEPEAQSRNTLALLVAHDGALIAERYAPQVSAATRLQGWSMNKSLMSTWVGMQAQRGNLDPAVPLRELLQGVDEAADLDPRLTLLHLLQMESGLDFAEVYGPGSDVTHMLYREPAMWKVPASRPQAHAPGEHFAYSSGDTVLAGFVWQRSLGQPFERWIAEQFGQALGIASLVAEADGSGVQVGSSYAYLTARDWLAAGQLWLDAWHGRSELLSQDWLRASVMARASDPRGRYGRGFWLNTGGVAFPGLPENLFYAGGNAGQYVVVIPDWELVVVRLGLSDESNDTGMHAFLSELARQRGVL